MAARLRLELERLDAVLDSLDGLASDLRDASADVIAAVAQAEAAERGDGSPVGGKLGRFKDRWEREMTLTAEDVEALVRTVRSAVQALTKSDESAESELREAQQ